MLKNLWQHPATSIAGTVIAALGLFLSQCPTSKYAAGATVVLGFISKDPWGK
jgi:hypothetical protein